jgi:Group II intron, maturase-specific domain
MRMTGPWGCPGIIVGIKTRLQWKRKPGTSKWYVCTFIADRPIRTVKDKVRALTRRTSQQPPRAALIRLHQIMRGWANYFKLAVSKHTLDALENFTWHRVIRWQRTCTAGGRTTSAATLPAPTAGGEGRQRTSERC